MASSWEGLGISELGESQAQGVSGMELEAARWGGQFGVLGDTLRSGAVVGLRE